MSTPCVGGTPSQAAIQGDTRSAAQRNHDARSPPAAPCWPPATSVNTTDYPPPSSSPPLCKNSKPAPESADRRRHPAADVRCDPAGRPRPPLPGDLRQGQSAGALSHQTTGLTGPTNCVVRQGSWVLVPRLHRARLSVRGPPLQPLRHQPRHRCQRPDFWPAAPTTNSPNKAGPPAKTPAATPNGSHHRTSTTGSHAPTPSITPRSFSRMTTTRRPNQRSEYRTGRCLSPPTNVVATGSGSPVSSIDFSLGISSEKKLLTSMRASAAPRQKCTP